MQCYDVFHSCLVDIFGIPAMISSKYKLHYVFRNEFSSVFMWRNHIPKLNITSPSESLVLSHKRPYRKLTFHNVLTWQGSYCNRARLNFQALVLRDMKIATRKGCCVGQKMSSHFSFCYLNNICTRRNMSFNEAEL